MKKKNFTQYGKTKGGRWADREAVVGNAQLGEIDQVAQFVRKACNRGKVRVVHSARLSQGV